jgi:hypothetical protein
VAEPDLAAELAPAGWALEHLDKDFQEDLVRMAALTLQVVAAEPGDLVVVALAAQV